MPFYIRKSISAGPFRFNLSKSGVGLSVGVKGLRVGTGPRGHYVHAGRGGIYYRASLGRAGQRPAAKARNHVVPESDGPLGHDGSGVVMSEIESGDVMEMRAETHQALLDELNAKQQQARLSRILPWSLAALGLVALLIDGTLAMVVFASALVGWGVGRWLDAYRRSSVLFYDLDGDYAGAYTRLTAGFDELMACQGKWHVAAGGAVQDLTTWKRNAGATRIVQKSPTAVHYALPEVVKSNVTPPALAVGRQTLFFLPDVVLVVDGRRVGAVAYAELVVRHEDSAFIEDGRVPGDATVVGHTWKHPNKNGGPDRRFANNYRIPICLYDVMHFRSGSGVNELVEFSRNGACAAFVAALLDLATVRQLKGETSAVEGKQVQPALV